MDNGSIQKRVMKILKQKQEIIRYIFWGILSAVLNTGLFQVLVILDIDYRISNIITLIIVKIFCYITNKLFVFKTPYTDLRSLLKELGSFIFARGFTFLVDFIGVIFWVERIGADAFVAKCIMAVIVIIINYILSKGFVFRVKKTNL